MLVLHPNEAAVSDPDEQVLSFLVGPPYSTYDSVVIRALISSVSASCSHATTNTGFGYYRLQLL